MITYSKRRGRRSLAAILAAMLMASVLAVVAGTPAQAANTSSEVLIDTDGDLVPDGREFAGRDRYDTALKLAHNFAGRSQYSSVSTVFVASGESLVDSITVAGLAGDNNAPVLLTRSGSLHGGVADYIEDHGVANVFVLGGTAAISEAVETAIEGLDSKPSVTRIPGVDRYDTAARIAAMIGGGSGPASSWCRTPSGGTSAGTDAVLINGSTDALPFGVAVSTIANKLRMPVLMTAADELPSSTADFIRDYDVEHVQIIGGTDTVSAEVANSLSSLGVDSVARTAGATAAEVSVELAKIAAAGGSCNSFLTPVANDRVVLVRGNPDGIAAAPVLASGIAGDTSHGSMVTPLIVGDTLPASVRDYLAATPKTVGTTKLDLGIIAIGGTAAVSAATMTAATTAAASTGALTVSIVNTADENMDGTHNDPVRPDTATAILVDRGTPGNSTGPKVSLVFSDAVDPANSLAALQDIIEINGVPAVVSNAVQGGACSNNVITVTLGQALNAGDVISVVSSTADAHKIGTGDDKRNVKAATATVTAKAPDRTAPSATIIGIADGTGIAAGATFTVNFSDAGGFPVMAADSSLEIADFTFTAAAGKGTTATNVVSNVVHTATTSAANKSFTATVTIGRTLEVGDRLTLKSGAIMDAARNSSRAVVGSAIKAQASPRITSVLMSRLVHSAHNAWAVPVAVVPGATGANEITIKAKGSGDAAGAAGNDWNVVFDQASTYSNAKPLDIDVRVDTKGKRVAVRFNNGPATATLGDLIDALNGTEDFSQRFSAAFSDCATGVRTTALGLVTPTPASARDVDGTVPATPGGQAADAGRTQYAIEVNFNAYIDSYTDTALLDDVLAQTATRNRAADSAALLAMAGSETANAAAAAQTAADPAGPVRTVRFEFEVSSNKLLPQARDLVDVDAGVDADNTASPAVAAVPAVATGYAANVPAAAGTNDTVNEDKNGASQVRIAPSSSVKAR